MALRLRLGNHLPKLGAVQKGASITHDLVGAQALLRQIIVELATALAEFLHRLVDRYQIRHQCRFYTAHLCLTRLHTCAMLPT